MDTTMTPDMPGPAAGLDLTIEEALTLQALWRRAEPVDWVTFDRLRLRVLAWSPPVSPGPARSEDVNEK